MSSQPSQRKRPAGPPVAVADAAPPSPPPPSKRRKPSKSRRRRMRDIEREAASRTLNGNGASPNLPPLPTTSTSDADAEADAEAGGGESGNGGLDTLFGHPYGALPHGNSLSSEESGSDPESVRSSGLGVLSVLNDELLILGIAPFLSGTDLGRIVRCSRFWYVAGHHTELWRDLTLRSFGESGFDFRDCWRDTFVLRTCRIREAAAKKEKEKSKSEEGGGGGGSSTPPLAADATEPPSLSTGSPKAAPAKQEGASSSRDKDKDKDNNGDDDKEDPPSFLPHSPIKISGIYSDTLFRSWLCRSFALRPSWLTVESIPRVKSSELTTDQFLTEYEERNMPVVITGATTTWPAVQRWKDRAYLLEKTFGVKFRATSGAAPLPANFTMESYMKYCDSATEEAPLYLFDRTFDAVAPQLARDYESTLPKTCPYFDPDALHGHDLFAHLGKGRRPDHRWIIVGPKRSGSAFHIDPNCTHAWNAPIVGRKRWIFYPPGVNPPGVYPSLSGDDVAMPISIGEWFLTYWDEHVRRRSDPDVARRPVECTVGPGDVLFVPHGWWHTVLNLDDGLSVALTQNYVSRSNLGDVLRFLETRTGQISGCRDRTEAVSPERLSEEFRKVLREKRPDLLELGERASEGGWSCDAWVDNDGWEVGGGSSGGCDAEEERPEKSTSILDRAKSSNSGTQVADHEHPAKTGDNGAFSFSFL